MQVGKLAILRAKVVAPLGDAVGFINGEQRNPGLFQQHLHTGRGQPFRSDIQKIQLACPQAVFHIGRLVIIEAGVQVGRLDSVLLKCRYLILHQRDQR